MTTNATMTAAVHRRFGPPEVVHLEQLPIPVPKAGEVVIRVHASTVSIADHRSRARDVPRGLGFLAAAGLGILRPRRRVLGMDAAGVIDAVGPGVSSFAPGDRVIALPGAAFGGHAEYLRMPADGPIALAPSTLPLDEAIALVFGGFTAYGFFKNVIITPGTTVLVNGASGAVGTAAIQLAAQRGAHVSAVTSGKNTALVTALGADEAIDYTREDFTADGRTWDVIVDCVGNAPFTRVEHSINPGGTLLLVINDLPGMLRARGQSRRTGKLVTGNVGSPAAADLAELSALTDAGQFRPVIDRGYDLADIVHAHRYVDTGRKVGNVVLRVRPA
ncbi:NAD(P)-dependent alcohol dehydrogenase [Microbacterium abyssi]|uniref:NAD(P)-dependent alcohol dehydrogenase n=1 Tax=Microbacterium abyssi TaxID=2782166 RepID=UPI0018883A9B|nr:NAD(P)-dependent alcohol dehydrogenase [Microbacterium sp. A18JL241]